MTGYTDDIRRWAIDLRRAGPLEGADGTGEVGLGTEEIGRRLAVRFAIRTRGRMVETVRFEVFGCGFTIAACAAAADLAEGRTLEEAGDIDSGDVDVRLNGLPPERAYCSSLAVAALQAAIRSARRSAGMVYAVYNPSEENHAYLPSPDDPLYHSLMESSPPQGIAQEDRHLFACLFAKSFREHYSLECTLGLRREDIDAILVTFFPLADPGCLKKNSAQLQESPPGRNDEVLGILLSHVTKSPKSQNSAISGWLAHILAARAAHPGHLWAAMGFFERSELTAAIHRHLPTLAEANNKGMRWKRYLFKQVCDRNGGVMCRAPDCGRCSEYALCFAEND